MKMTKIFAMALAALTIASCSKEEIGGSDNGIAGEELNAPTYATFKFNIGGASSRAATDYDPTTSADADATDKKIGNLQLLIFNEATQKLEHNSVITGDKSSETVLLTAGNKKIFFVANSDKLTEYTEAIDPEKFKVGENTLTEFYALNFNAGTPQQITADQDVPRTFDLSNLHTAASSEGGLPMSNTNEVTYTIVAGVDEAKAQGGTATAAGTSATNTFSMKLYYMIAKARLVLASGVLDDAGNLATKTPIIKDVKYSIRNLARITNYIQNVPTAGNPQSYYYSKTFADEAAFDAEFDYASNIHVSATTTVGEYLYVPENNYSMLLRGQSSYFAIKATFEPVVINTVAYSDVTSTVAYTYAKLADADANKNYIYTTQEVEGIPAETYFVSVEKFEEAVWIMKNKKAFVEDTHRTEAEALVTAGYYMAFTGANSYYRVDIGSGSGTDTQYGVLRSNKYDATINKITGPGVPKEEDLTTNPTGPVSTKTYISATIIPAKWSTITQSADL